MNKNCYNALQEFCDRQKDMISTGERDFIIRKFLESFYDTIQIQEQKNGTPLTDNEIRAIEQSLLGDKNLESYVDSAKKFIAATRESLIDDYNKQHRRNSFWRDIWVNMIAAFFYSILLLLLYVVAKDQISKWITDLLDTVVKTNIVQ